MVNQSLERLHVTLTHYFMNLTTGEGGCQLVTYLLIVFSPTICFAYRIKPVGIDKRFFGQFHPQCK